MARMTKELLCKCTGQTRRKRDETQEQFLRRITHLYCADKDIKHIDNLMLCRNLSVLYLYDNRIQDMLLVSSASHLTHLYLQSNLISRMDGLLELQSLEKLYLGNNSINVVEGLENCKNLRELHIENQRLAEGEKLLFDPRSLKSVSKTLMVLNVGGNGLDSLQDLICLRELTVLLAANNLLQHVRELGDVFDHMTHLWKVDLSGNPCSFKGKYRDMIITMARGIGVLDGRDVTDTERQFLKNWQAMRDGKLRPVQQSVRGEERGRHGHVPSAQNILQRLKESGVKPPTMPPLPQRPIKISKSKGSSHSTTFGSEGHQGFPFKKDPLSTILPPLVEEPDLTPKNQGRNKTKRVPRSEADQHYDYKISFLRTIPPVGLVGT